MKSHSIAAACALLVAFAPASQAALFKCKGADGKTVFSDQPCENAPSAAEKKAASAPDKGAKGPSAEDQARLKALDAITLDRKANSEQKTAAQLEAGNIRRNLEGQMTPADKAKREQLTKTLADPDSNKRAAALRELRTLYRD
jgi:uncharacterized protein DUF4124